MRMIDARCIVCAKERNDFLQRSSTSPIDPCECGGVMERILRESGHKTPNIQPDDIPGGVWIKHGICNADGTPRRYDSRSAMRKQAEAQGFTNLVEHVPDPKSGSDKSKHTQRFIGLPSALNPAEEAERLRGWHEHETALQQELTK